MADIGPLPSIGQKPWNLNPAIQAINAELEGRLSEEALNTTLAGAVAPADAFARGAAAGSISRSPVRVEDLTLDQFNNASVTLSMTGGVSYLNGTPGAPGARVWMPILGKGMGQAPAAGGLLASKATASSFSGIVFSACPIGTDPGVVVPYTGAGDDPAAVIREIGVYYIQGVGIVLRRSHSTGGQIVLVADSAITDGQYFDVSLFLDLAWQTKDPANPGKNFRVDVEVTGPTGTVYRGSYFPTVDFFPAAKKFGAITFRTNVAQGVRAARGGSTPVVGVGARVAAPSALYTTGTPAVSGVVTAERTAYWRPANPNGQFVIDLHGRGGGNVAQFSAAQYLPRTNALVALGFTVFQPNLFGDDWGSPVSMAALKELYDLAVNDWKLAPRCHLVGYSMGSHVAMRAKSLELFGPNRIASMTLMAPLADMSTMSQSSYPEIATIWGSTANQKANSAIEQPAEAFDGTPYLMFASTSDTVVPMAANYTPLMAKWNGRQNVEFVQAVGAHDDLSHFQAQPVVQFVKAHAGI